MRRLLSLLAGLGMAACEVDSPTMVELGAELYSNHCAACHGSHGEGDGPLATVMLVSVPNLRTLSQRHDGAFPSDAAAAYIDGRDLPVSHGDRYMPVWGNVFGWPENAEPQSESIVEMRIAALVAYLEQLQYRSAL